MAITDMYQITHEMTYLGQKVISVYHVERQNAGESAGSINDAFGNSILPTLRLLQNTFVFNGETRVFNLGTPTDFGTFTLGGALGLRAGLHSPSFIAGAMRFNTLNRDVRSGQKRFVGMLEGDYTAGDLSAATITLINNIGAVLVADWLASSDSHIVCQYAIIKRVCEEFDPVTGECLKYRLPETDAELVFYRPLSFLTNPEISSQVSRKTF